MISSTETGGFTSAVRDAFLQLCFSLCCALLIKLLISHLICFNHFIQRKFVATEIRPCTCSIIQWLGLSLLRAKSTFLDPVRTVFITLGHGWGGIHLPKDLFLVLWLCLSAVEEHPSTEQGSLVWKETETGAAEQGPWVQWCCPGPTTGALPPSLSVILSS